MKRAALLAILVAGCGSSSAADRGGRVATVCTVVDHGSDVQVQLVATDAQRACAAWVRDHSGAGAFWSVGHLSRVYARNAWTHVCTMRASTGALAAVYDDGGQSSGKGVCGEFAGAGWTEVRR